MKNKKAKNIKVLIWIGCIFIHSFVIMLINKSGILLGGIPTVILIGCMFLVANILCKKVDNRTSETNSEVIHSDDFPK